MAMRVAAYGGGVNSTAMLIALTESGVKLDLILFADTGGERQATMRYVGLFSRWLVARGQPAIVIVRKTTKRAGKFRGAGETLSLERRCLEEKTLPSIAYGFKSCSMKFKREPQDEYVRLNAPEQWSAGQIIKYMGIDAGESHRARLSADDHFVYKYPLVHDFMWDREECVEQILSAGLCVPPKSSCFFCPNMTEEEILRLRDEEPDLMQRALALESNAVSTPGSTIKGLGRSHSWRDVLRFHESQHGLFPILPQPAVPCECWD